jgi:type IV pilus assembly protein PilY1
MKSIKTLCILVPFLCLLFTLAAFAADTDLYVGGGLAVKPNILILFDNSGSMGDPPGDIAFCEYDPSHNYPIPAGQPSLTDSTRDKVYKKVSGNWFPLSKYKDTVGQILCVAAQTPLTTYGQGLYGPGKSDNADCSSGSNRTLATGRYLRYLYADQELKEACSKSKMEIAQGVIENFLNTIQGVKIGAITFNDNTEGGYILHYIPASDEQNQLDNDQKQLITDINDLYPNSWTPLAETLYEAGLYFQGAQSYFNSPDFTESVTTYTSPITRRCQKNYVIIMTDGMSTQDRHNKLNTAIGDRDGDHGEPPCDDTSDPDPLCYVADEGSDYLDDVAKYLYDTDLRSDLDTKQNVVTYTIGFELDLSGGTSADKAKKLLQRTATLGHGKFYTTAGAGALADAFSNILNEVLAKTSSFVAPIVPVSRLEKTTAGDKIYLAFFRPNQSGMWSGNIKKYGVAQQKDKDKGIEVGDILDASGLKALDANGEFYPSSKSLDWTTSSTDGGEVEVGGVGEVLKKRTTARKIYTLLPGDAQDEDDGPDGNTTFNLTDLTNAFATTNSRITPSLLFGSGTWTTQDKDDLINFVQGIDSYDDNMNNDKTDKRDWLLGSFLHSRPKIISYKTQTVIYAGANDGMLHAFDDVSGEELWAFIPPILLGRLKELHTDNPGIFVDGSPAAYVTYDGSGNVTKAILIFGLRRGGNYYYALDVTTPSAPKYLWRIYKGKNGNFNQIGQTWSTPVIGKVAYGTGEKWVAIFGGGYDVGQDDDNPPADTDGRGIYVADVLTGAYVWGKSYIGGETTITYCIPGDVAKLDLDGDGRIDRLYVGDMNARIFRFDIGDLNNNGNSDPDEWAGKMIFHSNSGSAEKRKIFYPPDVTLEKQDGVEFEMLFFGTGNREDPKDDSASKVDRLYAFKDKNKGSTSTWTNLGESDLVDVTADLLDDPSTSQTEKNTILGNLKALNGWYIKAERHSGEKCLASPLVYAKTAYYTTFSPTIGEITDPCFVGEGIATLYAVNYMTGEAVLDLDLTNDSGGKVVFRKSDRAVQIGTAIPSGVVITVIGGKVTAYAGVGGGVDKIKTTSTRSIFPLSWKLIF